MWEDEERDVFLSPFRKAKVLSVLDLDIPPSAAVNEACLGSMEEVVNCVKNADILKPAYEAAEELLQVMTGGSPEDVKKWGKPSNYQRVFLL